jgi:hypothetical protein
MSRKLSRRSMLGATAAATAAAAVGSELSLGSAIAAGSDPRGQTENVGELRQLEALSTPAIGEDVRFYAAGSLNPNGIAAGTTLAFGGARGVRPVNGGATTNYASASVDVPLGSTLTNIEYIVEGTQAGRVALIRWTADAAVAQTYLYQQTLPGAGSGIVVYSSPLTEVVDGLHTYEAFFTDNGTPSATTFCNGIRVRFRPPSSGLVPITPARVYDSRLNMAPDANGTITGGSNRTVSVANARNVATGAIIGAVVPANATAIAYTLTISDTTGQGYLAVNPGGVTVVSASTINWFGAGQILANTGVVKVANDRTITVVAGGGSTNFIVDVVGYFL